MMDMSFENVNYVPLLPWNGVGIGRHNGMILPNSARRDPIKLREVAAYEK